MAEALSATSRPGIFLAIRSVSLMTSTLGKQAWISVGTALEADEIWRQVADSARVQIRRGCSGTPSLFLSRPEAAPWCASVAGGA
jgi:hypothetical protein